jgi:alkyl sulfatase BDS1-like metallo-beta-lactamase superfamily hydrolase
MFNYDDVLIDDVMIDEMMIEKEVAVRVARDKAEKKLTRLVLNLNEALSEYDLELSDGELQAFQDAIDELMASVE